MMLLLLANLRHLNLVRRRPLFGAERARDGAFLINKFRGDISLLEPGLRELPLHGLSGVGVLRLGAQLGPILWQIPPVLRFDYEIVIRTSGDVAAAGHTVHASVDPTGRPTRLPAKVRDLFA